jgi:hypothetical protein
MFFETEEDVRMSFENYEESGYDLDMDLLSTILY